MAGATRDLEFGKIKVGAKSLDDAVLNLGSLRTGNRYFTDKNIIIKALADNDIGLLRDISNYFYRTNGIYQKVCNYAANMYRYDWYIVPEIYDSNVKTEKVMSEFSRTLSYLDNSYIKKVCADIALKVIINGAYYGYVTSTNEGLVLQELPAKYCRSRYSIGPNPTVEFDMRFFDEKFTDTQYRLKVLNMFPKEFSQGYILYKQGKLPSDSLGDTKSWYLLDPANAVKFNFSNGDIPFFVNAVPSILDLDAAQDLDRRKQMQQLLKILVQKLPLDKNGDLIFDIDEAKDIHNNAVQMLRRAIGVDILTTFADIEAVNISDNTTATTRDDLEKVERSVFNSLGISQNLFNTDGNLSLEKSILTDEGSVRYLVKQFETFFDKLVAQKNAQARKSYHFRFYMLGTTQYNYKDLAKLYKEQTNSGFSKVLPQIALGHSQSSIINTAYFENDVLQLSKIMIPPLMSSTLNAEDVLGTAGEESQGGRPEKEESEKSDKTLQNLESLS